MRTRTIIIVLAVALSGLSLRAFAQDAEARALQDLQEALKQKQELENQINNEERALIEEVQVLDSKVLELSKTLREAQAEEALVSTDRKQLDDELERRRVEFDYLRKNFNTYGSEIVNRLHVAENQVYEDRLDDIAQQALAAGSDLSAEMLARVEALNVGIARLLEHAGGHSFEGKAAGPSNEIKSGRFALLGPVGYFAANDGSLVGMTGFKAGDVNIPSIQEMKTAAEREKMAQLVKTGEATVPVDATMGKAFQVEEGKRSLRAFLRAGGVVGYAIVGFGFIALGLAVFKLVEILRFRVPSRGEVNEILDGLLAGKREQAIEKASGLPGLGGRVVEAGARYFFAKRRVMEDALYEKMTAVQPRLDRLLPFMAVIAAAAPMAGLLGTVLGIMKTFEMMAEFGTGDAKYTAGGIGEALITTFLGLVVAIPTIMVHGVLKSLARTRLGQVEGVALAMINGTTEITKAEGDSARDEEDEEELMEEALVEQAT